MVGYVGAWNGVCNGADFSPKSLWVFCLLVFFNRKMIELDDQNLFLGYHSGHPRVLSAVEFVLYWVWGASFKPHSCVSNTDHKICAVCNKASVSSAGGWLWYFLASKSLVFQLQQYHFSTYKISISDETINFPHDFRDLICPCWRNFPKLYFLR